MLKRFVSLFFIALFLISLAPPQGYTEVAAQERLDPTIISDLTLPAVVFIVTIIQATIEIPIPDETGTPTADFFTVDTMTGGIGSGFFINNDGYIVTNGHVVFAFTDSDPNNDLFVKRLLVESAAETIINQLIQQGVPLSPDEAVAIIQYVVQYGRVRDLLRTVLVIVGESSGGKVRQDGIQARVIGNPEPFLGRDLAVIKIEASNTPSLPLAESEEIQPGQTVYAFGYPGVVNFHEMLSQDTLLFPSMTSGIVGGLRKTNQDIPAVQMDADIAKGNSGGPVLNDKGEVIGVANMGSLYENLQPAAGFNFFIPLSVLKQYLNELNIQYNTRGPVDQLWYEAIGYYYAGLYNRAKELFEEVRTLYPFNWYATTMIQKAQNKIAEGNKVNAVLELVANATEVEQGKAVEISGTLKYDGPNPLGIDVSFKDVQIDLTFQIDGSTETRSVRVGEDNSFSLTYVPESSGVLTITARWVGDEDFNSVEETLTVNVAAVGLPVWMIAAPLLILIAAGAFIAYSKGLIKLGGKARPTPAPQPMPRAPTENVVYCPNCGSPNKPTAKFCVSCGSRLGGE